MAINITMPALSPTMEEGTLAKWNVKPGDTVEAGDIIAEIETDKATMEVEAVDEGTVAQILVDDEKFYAPAIATYPFAGQTIGIPSVRTTWTDDIALSVLSFPEDGDDAVVLRATVQPLIVWLWVGGIVMAVGTVLAVVPGRRRDPIAPTSAPIEDSPPDPPAGDTNAESEMLGAGR